MSMRSSWPVAVLIALFHLQQPAQAQSPVIADLRAVQVGEAVQLNWRIPAGQSCLNMEVQRSADNQIFETRQTVFGLCGSEFSDVPYDFRDEMLPEGMASYWYRIYASSGTVISDTVQLTYRWFAPGSLVISPNPLTADGQISYFAPNGEQSTLHIIDLQGKSERLFQIPAGQSFDLKKMEWISGTYLVEWRGADGTLRASGKLLVP